jgi:hypothetical protein
MPYERVGGDPLLKNLRQYNRDDKSAEEYLAKDLVEDNRGLEGAYTYDPSADRAIPLNSQPAYAKPQYTQSQPQPQVQDEEYIELFDPNSETFVKVPKSALGSR